MTIDINILKRFFEGRYSRKDFEAIREKLESEDDDREIRELMLSHWVEFGSYRLPDEDVDHILHKLQHMIRLEENREAKRFGFVRTFQKIAAILIVPLALAFMAYLVYQPKAGELPEAWAEIQCPMGVRTRFVLPDGTTGFLNSGSTLGYPVRFGEARQVTLSGEGYFDVKQEAGKPFQIKTTGLNIKVLGTTFNVIAYPDEKTEEVILQSGKVEIGNIRGDQIAELDSNQKILYDRDENSARKIHVVASQYTSWREGKLVFRNENMEQVALRLGRWYNAEIVLADDGLKKYSFHATFLDEQLDEVLKLLALTTPISYEEVKREAIAGGVYPKRRIILKLNPEKIQEFK